MAESAHADDGDARAWAGVPALERRISGDACAQQRCRLRGVEAGGDREDEVLVRDDLLRVAALRDRAVGGVGPVVGLGVAGQAVLVAALQALAALTTGVGLAADADGVADLVLGDGAADLDDAADDLVADDLRIGDGAQSPRIVWMSEWQMPA